MYTYYSVCSMEDSACTSWSYHLRTYVRTAGQIYLAGMMRVTSRPPLHMGCLQYGGYKSVSMWHALLNICRQSCFQCHSHVTHLFECDCVWIAYTLVNMCICTLHTHLAITYSMHVVAHTWLSRQPPLLCSLCIYLSWFSSVTVLSFTRVVISTVLMPQRKVGGWDV